MNWGNGKPTKQGEIEQAARDLADRENRLAERQAGIDQATRDLADRENRLTMQEAEIGRRDRLSRSREARLDEEVAEKVKSSLAVEIERREAELEKIRDGLAIRGKKLSSLEARIVERARATAEREAVLRAAEDRIRARESEASGRADAFANKEAEQADRERKLLDKEMAADAAIVLKEREALEALAREHASLVAKIGELNAELAEARRTRFESLENELVEEARRRRQALDEELREARHYAEALKGHHRSAIDEQAAEHQRLQAAAHSLQADLARARVERFEQLDRELADEAARKREGLDRESQDARQRAAAAIEEETRALADAERLRSEASTRFATLDAELTEARRTRSEAIDRELADEAARKREALEREAQDARRRASSALEEEARALADAERLRSEASARLATLDAELTESRRTRFEQLERELGDEAVRRREGLERETQDARRRASAALEEEARSLAEAERLRSEVAARFATLDAELAEVRRSRFEQLERALNDESAARQLAFARSIEEAERLANDLRDGHRASIDALANEHAGLIDAIQSLQADLAQARVERFEQLDRELVEESTTRRDALADELKRGRERAEAELSVDLEARRSETDRVRRELALDRDRLRAVEADLLAREDTVRVKNTQLSTGLLLLEEDRGQFQKRFEERLEQEISEMRLDCEMKDRRIEDLRHAYQKKEEKLAAFEDLERRFRDKNPEEIEQKQRDLEKKLERLTDELIQRPLPEVKQQLRQALEAESGWKSQLEAAGRELGMLRSERSKWLTSVGELEEQKNLCEINFRVKESLLAQIKVFDTELERLKNMTERPEEREARIEVIRMEYLDRERSIEVPPDVTPSEVDWLTYIHEMCGKSGLFFPKRLMDAFHTSLKTAEWSPLTVLAGVSGTGKSELPRLYSRFGGLNFLGLPVQPNWDSPQSLFGFFNSVDNRFNATPLLQSLEQAQREPGLNNGLDDQMLVILLDEMNLAYVELYFSDLLSKLESRRGRAEEPLEIDIGAGFDKHKLALTRNVLWVGTMNEDETTKTLSDKVLDRSNVIGFPRPRELKRRESADLQDESLKLPWWVWTKWSRARSWFTDDQIRPYKDLLQDINVRLERAGRALGHRVWQSIEHYMANHPTVLEAEAASDAEALSKGMVLAFEDQLVQKVMPKLRGIETTGKHRTECLDQIRSRLDTFTGLHLLYDFDMACSSDFGGFVWKSARYLEAGE